MLKYAANIKSFLITQTHTFQIYLYTIISLYRLEVHYTWVTKSKHRIKIKMNLYTEINNETCPVAINATNFDIFNHLDGLKFQTFNKKIKKCKK